MKLQSLLVLVVLLLTPSAVLAQNTVTAETESTAHPPRPESGLASAAGPWRVGPSPSATQLDPGLHADASLVGLTGGFEPLEGARLSVGVAPTSWFYASLSYARRAGWRMCPDCLTDATSLTLRGDLLRTQPIRISVWTETNMTQTSALDIMPGVAIEGGTRRLRFDASSPIWSSYDLLTTLRIAPEAGVSYTWTSRHTSRVAVVGLEPGFAAQHRWRFTGNWTLDATLRHGEEGTGGELGISFRL